ncbi:MULTISPECIES: sec-independent translocase [unclassified Streptomyces]|uniref:sec-independent translocase n=1 Tax=unclassified Streptomyces TaxID=2593676 RepID=UPI000CD59256|nr:MULTISPECIES: sec-independent translocase [unclassified Streptomyces]
MFFDIGSVEFLVLLILAVLLFGPDKLPKLIQDAMGFIRKVREYSDSAKQDIRSELGPEFKDFEFEDLHPKRFAQKHLAGRDDLGLRELRDSLDVRKELTEVTDSINGRARPGVNGTDGGDGVNGIDGSNGVSVKGDTASPGDPAALDKGFAPEDEMAADGAATNHGGVRLEKEASGAPAGPSRTPATPAPPFDMDAT